LRRNNIITQEKKDKDFLDRRKVLFGMLGSMGLAVTSFNVKAMTRFLDSDMSDGGVSVNWEQSLTFTPSFYTDDEIKSVALIANVIIPKTDTLGAVEAGVPLLMDTLYANWANNQTQKKHRNEIKSLSRLIKEQLPSFVTASYQQQMSVIKAIDQLAFSARDKRFSSSENSVLTAYKALKNIITRTYYSTEEGMTKELRYMLIPGRWDACLKADENTRAWA
jgi:hypothetical protein